MDGREALEAHAQSLEVVQPGNGAFDNPSGLAEATAVRFTATGNFCGNARGMKRFTVMIFKSYVRMNDERGSHEPRSSTTVEDR